MIPRAPELGALPAAEMHLSHLTQGGDSDSLEPREVLPVVRSGALPYAAEVYASLRCGTCGRVPGEGQKAFSFCSLCRDPAAGRFCCKEPCFAAFWWGGHKLVCKGRDKAKGTGRAGGGGGGGGGGSAQ
jgi:hypothetical protein